MQRLYVSGAWRNNMKASTVVFQRPSSYKMKYFWLYHVCHYYQWKIKRMRVTSGGGDNKHLQTERCWTLAKEPFFSESPLAESYSVREFTIDSCGWTWVLFHICRYVRSRKTSNSQILLSSCAYLQSHLSSCRHCRRTHYRPNSWRGGLQIPKLKNPRLLWRRPRYCIQPEQIHLLFFVKLDLLRAPVFGNPIVSSWRFNRQPRIVKDFRRTAACQKSKRMKIAFCAV